MCYKVEPFDIERVLLEIRGGNDIKKLGYII